MDVMKIFEINGSAMNAQSVRLNTVASNMANANVTASSPDAVYRAKEPIFQSILNQHGVSQVNVAGITEHKVEPLKQYAPDHPQANEEGYVFRPNINLVDQMANMISASRSYQSNVEVINTTKDMALQTLQMGR